MIEASDHRRFAEGKMAEHVKKAEERVAAQKALLPQSPSELANTGDAHLDKLLRSIQDLLNTADEHIQAIATKGMTCVQDDMIKLQQFEYFYTKGKSDAYKEVAQIPARIVAESKGLSV